MCCVDIMCVYVSLDTRRSTRLDASILVFISRECARQFVAHVRARLSCLIRVGYVCDRTSVGGKDFFVMEGRL